MQLHFDLVADGPALQQLCEKIAAEPLIAFDTEFVRENTFSPELGLMQVATAQEAWLVDALAFSTEQIRPFLDLLQDPKILKVLHSAYGDQECLYYSYEMTASPTLDTFEAASLLGYGESVSLRDLAKSLLGVKLTKGHTRTDWLKRPMNEAMKNYALADVEHLVEIGMLMIEDLEKLSRKDWALSLSAHFENPKLYQNSADEIAARLAQSGRVSRRAFTILKDLVAWREERARRINVPRRRVADDGTLMDLANVRPQSVHELERFRGLNRGEAQRQGGQILGIIENAMKKPEESLPDVPKPLRPTRDQSRIIDLLATYLRFLSEDLRIAPRQLLTVDKLRKIVVQNLLDPSRWFSEGICPPQVAELIGEEICAMLRGGRALTIEAGALKIIQLTGDKTCASQKVTR